MLALRSLLDLTRLTAPACHLEEREPLRNICRGDEVAIEGLLRGAAWRVTHFVVGGWRGRSAS
jgi:hypothetical protein